MFYTLIEKSVAEKHGFSEVTHRIVGDRMVINEKELLFSNIKGDTLDGKLARLGGKRMSEYELNGYIKKGGY